MVYLIEKYDFLFINYLLENLFLENDHIYIHASLTMITIIPLVNEVHKSFS